MHIPVLLEQVLALFRGQRLTTFVDATLGACGHSLAVLSEHPEIELLIGIDQDREALAIAQERLKGVHAELLHGNFCRLAELVLSTKRTQVDAILLDIGVSSMQIDTDTRGFSFLRDGPLDMRMDQTRDLTAEEIVNSYSRDELADIFYTLGEERRSRQAAKAICEARKRTRIDTTTKLVEVLSHVLFRQGKIHPATRVFQALRIAVNAELDVLRLVLPQAVSLLAPGGTLAVISFHSLEDRIVKEEFRRFAKENPELTILTKKPIEAERSEWLDNPRARSAKLRAIHRAA